MKKILLDKTLKNHYVYEQILSLFESRIINQHISDFFNEIKDEIDFNQNNHLIYHDISSDLQTSPLDKSKLFNLFKSSSEKDLNLLALVIEKVLWNTKGSMLLEKALELMKNHLDLKDFYKRIKKSENLRKIMAQLAEQAVRNDVNLSEKIIDLCINDADLCGESNKLHSEAAAGEEHLRISTMRAHLCFAIKKYIIKYNDKTDEKSLKKLEKAFSWVKLLMDLDGSLASKVKGFPKPNYYLRDFAIMPLINLAHHEIRNKLNDFKKGLGYEIKNLAFAIIEKTKEETERNKYTPLGLFNKISRLFDYMRDLDEKSAEQFLSFVKHFRVKEANHLFIYYALFRERFFKEKGSFNSERFKSLLKDICKGEPDQLKQSLAFTIYESIANKKQNGKSEPDFKFFEQVKDYWVLLFENISKNMYFSLFMTLSFVLKNESYYQNYKKYFFQLIDNALGNLESSGYFLHINRILPAITKNNPDDLVETLLLFLKKGDFARGYIPFGYEVRQKLIPEIKKIKNKISQKKICQAKEELKKYNINL